MGQQDQQNYQDRSSGNPPQKTAAARRQDKEPDDAYFARQRERMDPKAPENMDEKDDTQDLNIDTRNPKTSRR